MTQFWFVRHGPTHRKDVVGWTDAPADLSDRVALVRLQRFLPKDALIISSDLQRAVATADAIEDTRERLEHDARLREYHFGEWEGRTFKEISASHPALSKSYWSEPGDIAAPGGESWNEGASRAEAAITELEERHRGKDIVVVAHFGVILNQIQAATKMAAKSAIGFQIENLSVTRIEFMDGGFRRVLGVNHIP